MDERFALWQSYHMDELNRKDMDPLLKDGWDKSLVLGIDPTIAIPRLLTPQEFEKAKSRSETLFIYSHENLTMMAAHIQMCNIGILLFDMEATLLTMYGGASFFAWAEANNIRRKTSWLQNEIGVTAISVGMSSLKPFHTSGEENFAEFAQKISVFFSPIFSEGTDGEKKLVGGVAVVGPAGEMTADHLMTAEAIAHSIDQHFFWIRTVNFISEEGTIVVEQNTRKNKIHLINAQAFSVLHIPFREMINHSLQELVPYEKNEEFWNCFLQRKELVDTNAVLYVDGKAEEVNISLRSFANKSFRVDGTLITINSRSRTQNIISKYAGANATFTFERIIGQDPTFLAVLSAARSIARYDSNVLLLGESGTGKDIIAQSIHNASPRCNKPFITINCAALPRELIASELFGYDDGTFTGGKRGGKVGKFELANQGTIFLDEIGEMPLDLQATLLRIIEEHSFMRLGGDRYVQVDVRIIAATNSDLQEKIQRNTFRKDLFFRLGTTRLQIPPLRKRKTDILLLSQYFIEKVCTKIDRQLTALTEDAKEFLYQYDWPGNVRELQSLFESVLEIYNDSSIGLHHIQGYLGIASSGSTDMPNPPNGVALVEAVEQTDDKLIYQALLANRFNQSKTALQLGISRKTLYRKIKKYNLH